MRYLVVGAGALGGYFGGRLLEAGPRRHLPAAPGPGAGAGPHRAGDQEPLRRRHPAGAAVRAEGEPAHAVRRRRRRLQGLRPGRDDGVVRARGRPADGDPAAAQRPRPLRRPAAALRRRAGARRPLHDLGRARRRRHGAALQRLPRPRLRRARRLGVGAGRGDAGRLRRREVRGAGVVADAARALGEVGLHRRGGGDHLPDARQHRRHRRRRRGRPERAAARGMPRHRRGQRLRAAAGGDRALPRRS